MTTEIIVVRVKPKLKAELQRLALSQDMTMAEVYRAAFVEYCSARLLAHMPPGAIPELSRELVPELAGQGEQGR